MDNWEETKQRKEESIRESTNNPMPDINGKSYKNFSDYLASKEYKEFLDIQDKALIEYQNRAKEYFKSLEVDNQLMLFFHITNCIFENYFKDSGSYRGLLYDKFGFGPDSYSLGMDSGMFSLHNSISTPKENEERFQKLMKFLNLELTHEQINSARNYFYYGHDMSKKLKDLISNQQSFNFDEE